MSFRTEFHRGDVVYSKYCTVERKEYHLRVKKEKVDEWLYGDKLIQDALCDLSPAERDFIMHKLTPAEQEDLLPEEYPEDEHECDVCGCTTDHKPTSSGMIYCSVECYNYEQAQWERDRGYQ
jgi:hypothetical protein